VTYDDEYDDGPGAPDDDFGEFQEPDDDENGLPEDPPEGAASAERTARAQGYLELARLLQLSRKDLREAAKRLGLNEARYIVDCYYQWQEYRIAAAGQVRALTAGTPAEPAEALQWVQAQMVRTEDDLRAILEVWTKVEPSGMAAWARQHIGVGPVIAAGLRAHLDITRARTVGHWWRFGGLDPSNEWLGREKAEQMVREAYQATGCKASDPPDMDVLAWLVEKTHRSMDSIVRLSKDKQGKQTRKALEAGLARRPWNASLKVLLWKLGESFVKMQNHEACFFGKVFAVRKAKETAANLRGAYADQAEAKLARYNIGKDTDAYAWYSGSLTVEAAKQILAAPAAERQGLTKKLAGAPGSGPRMLPPAHIHARAKRYAVKLFLSQYHEENYRRYYHRLPPVPFAMEHLGHVHKAENPVPFTPVPGEDDRTPQPKDHPAY
jgi:ribosomal protein S14